MAKTNDHNNFCFISADIDNYHDKCQIFIYFKLKAVETKPFICFLNIINI